MICLELREASHVAPFQKAPWLIRVLLTSVAIFVVMICMVAIEVQNEHFEGLAAPGPTAMENSWELLD